MEKVEINFTRSASVQPDIDKLEVMYQQLGYAPKIV